MVLTLNPFKTLTDTLDVWPVGMQHRNGNRVDKLVDTANNSAQCQRRVWLYSAVSWCEAGRSTVISFEA